MSSRVRAEKDGEHFPGSAVGENGNLVTKPIHILHKEQGHSALQFGPAITSSPLMPVGRGAKYDSLPFLKHCIHEAATFNFICKKTKKKITKAVP